MNARLGAAIVSLSLVTFAGCSGATQSNPAPVSGPPGPSVMSRQVVGIVPNLIKTGCAQGLPKPNAAVDGADIRRSFRSTLLVSPKRPAIGLASSWNSLARKSPTAPGDGSIGLSLTAAS